LIVVDLDIVEVHEAALETDPGHRRRTVSRKRLDVVHQFDT